MASQLRLSADVTDAEDPRAYRPRSGDGRPRQRRQTVIRDLSGGQKKHVSIAIELISEPAVLFLDEVTSGLDLGTEREMMQLFRRLADGGVTIAVCITHFLDSLSECDNVVALMRGKLVFHGPPAAMKDHFGIAEMHENIYGLEATATPDQSRDRFVASEPGQRAAQALAIAAGGAVPAPQTPQGKPTRTRGEFALQWSVLTRRYVALLLADRRMLAFLLGLAPLIGVMLCIYGGSIDVPDTLADGRQWQSARAHPACPRHPKGRPATRWRLSSVPRATCSSTSRPSATTPPWRRCCRRSAKNSPTTAATTGSSARFLFGMLLGTMFLSMFSSVQEIVKETSIYMHERFVRLQLAHTYLLSKIGPLFPPGGVQVLLLQITISAFSELDAGWMAEQFPLLFAVSAVGTLVGLTISSAVPGGREEGGAMLLIAVVIPQVLFSGGLGGLHGLAKLIGRPSSPATGAFRASAA